MWMNDAIGSALIRRWQDGLLMERFNDSATKNINELCCGGGTIVPCKRSKFEAI